MWHDPEQNEKKKTETGKCIKNEDSWKEEKNALKTLVDGDAHRPVAIFYVEKKTRKNAGWWQRESVKWMSQIKSLARAVPNKPSLKLI